MSNDKYKMFKNYMFNELGITKEDIQLWIQESITKEVEKAFNQDEFVKMMFQRTLETLTNKRSWEMDTEVVRNVKEEVLQKVKDTIIIDVSLKNND